MLRTITWYAYFWGYLVYTAFLLIKPNRLNKENRIDERNKAAHAAAKNWARDIVNFSGAKIKVIGEENIPEKGGVLFVANHQSNMDIPIMIGFVPRDKGLISKIELSRVPVFSTWMKYIGCIFINRGHSREALATINEGAESLKSGHALVIFPEGTRTKDGTVGKFKPGSIKLAMKAKVPIVPVTIKDSMKLMPKGKFIVRPVTVEVIIAPAIIIDESNEKDSVRISEEIRNTIIENLK